MHKRFRDYYYQVGSLPTGPQNALSDVAGVLVGHCSRIEGQGDLVSGDGPIRTGVTLIRPHGGNLFQEKVPAAVYTINGFGKAAGFEQIRELGLLETPIALTNTLNVGKVSDALVSLMIEQNPTLGITSGTVNPVVGECHDGFLNDIQGRHIGLTEVQQAYQNASDTVLEGNVGGGVGTQCYQFKGGIGTASRLILDKKHQSQPFTVGVLVQTNFGLRHELQILGVPVGQHLSEQHLPEVGGGSVMIILATDAPLNQRQLERLARRVPFGLARTGTVCHDGSGDFVIAFSTAYTIPHERDFWLREQPYFMESGRDMDRFFRAVVEAVEEAVYNALFAAQTLEGRDGNRVFALPIEETLALLKRYNRHPGR